MRRTLTVATALIGVAATPLLAQQAQPTLGQVLTLRVDKLEKEMKAVQRKVFPDGVAVQPELGGNASLVEPDGTPATTPVADLTARVDALESQIKSLTGQVEQDGNRLRKLEDALKTTDARLKALEGGATGTAAPETAAPKPAAATPVAASQKPAAAAPKPAAKPVAATTTATTATPKPDAKRAAAIKAAVEIPATDDPIEDAYTYGFRLWSAKFYPEAEAQLKDFVARYPKHKRASYAQNLLGRAFLDEGKPKAASMAFFENYQTNPKGERAAESLYWLGISLTRLQRLPDACKVYKEFDQVYGGTAPSDLKSRVSKARADAKCAA